MADGVHDEHDEHKPPEAEALSQFKKLCQSVPESAKQAFAEEVAVEAKKLAQSVGAESLLVMESASESSTAIVIRSGAVADAEGTSEEMLKRGKHMICRRVILLVRRRP